MDLKKSNVNTLCFYIEQHRYKDGHMQHGVVEEVLQLHQSSCPWFTRGVINSALQHCKKSTGSATQTTCSPLSTITPTEYDALPKNLVGCRVAREGRTSMQPTNCCVNAPGRTKGITEAARKAHKEKIHRVRCVIMISEVKQSA
jgi:hypothetical protein